MTNTQRASQDNGIWMCYTHGKQVDGDEFYFEVSKLKQWKELAEARAQEELGRPLRTGSAAISVSVHSHGGAGGAGGAGAGGGGGGGAMLGAGGAGGEPPRRTPS